MPSDAWHLHQDQFYVYQYLPWYTEVGHAITHPWIEAPWYVGSTTVDTTTPCEWVYGCDDHRYRAYDLSSQSVWVR